MRLYLRLIKNNMTKKSKQPYKKVENIQTNNKNKKSYLSYFLCCFYPEDDTIATDSQRDSVVNMQNSYNNNTNSINEINEIIENIILYNHDIIEQNLYAIEEDETKENDIISDTKSDNKLDSKSEASLEELKI